MKKQDIEELISLIEKDPASEFRHFFKASLPTTDLEYIDFLVNYLYIKHNLRDIVPDFFNSPYINPVTEDFRNRMNLREQFNRRVDEKFNSLRSQMDFEPRLEKYAEDFPKEDQGNILKLIGSYLYHVIYGETSYKSLLDISKEVIEKNFILNLNEEHKLFIDRVIEVDEDRLKDKESFINKHILFRQENYKIFTGQELTESEIASILGSHLLEKFGISDKSDLLINEYNSFVKTQEIGEDVSDDEEELTLDLDNIEDLYQENNVDKTEDVIEEKDDVTPGELTEYYSELEYLYEESKWLKLLIERKKLLWKEDIIGDKPERMKKAADIQRFITRQRNICDIRLEKSKRKRFLPNLERLCQKLKLNDFEKNVVKYLSMPDIFIYDDSLIGRITIADLILMFIDDPIERIKNKSSFLKNSKLIRSGILTIENNKKNSIFELEVHIDSRLVEYIQGENYDISNYIEGGHLFLPNTDIENVILDSNKKNNILNSVEKFPLFLETKKNLKYSNIVEYGNALVMLFTGPSGTGKTMMSRALANHLNKKLLSFNFNTFSDYQYIDNTNPLTLLFREARIHNAVLLFDESERILEERINDLLIEIEKHEGIVIFATNAELKINEAMRRRINLVVKFDDPGPAERKEIWKIHLPLNIKIHNNMDLDEIARKYELNGGLIKNAVFSAIARAVNETNSSNPTIKMEHLIYGAEEQLYNKIFMSKLKRQIIPKKKIESLIFNDKISKSIEEIINIEKAKKVLDNNWGFSEIYPESKGVKVLFYGPSGTGKTAAAEAIAKETGKAFEIVNYSQVISMYVGQTEKSLEELLTDAANRNAILLFDEADALFAKRTDVKNSLDRYANIETDVLLSLIEKNDVFAILTTNHLEAIDPAFFRRMDYTIKFDNPNLTLRKRMWRKLLPKKMPVDSKIDFDLLAKNYSFNGGDIKNVIQKAAIKAALDLDNKKIVEMEDFLTACEEIKDFKEGESSKIGF